MKKINFRDYEINEVIHIIREWTNLSQKDFAKKIGKSERTVQDYERGEYSYNAYLLKTLIKEFDIEIEIRKK